MFVWEIVNEGEGLDAMGGANADNQNAMREATVHGSEIAGAEMELVTKPEVSAQNINEIEDASEMDLGVSGSRRFAFIKNNNRRG